MASYIRELPIPKEGLYYDLNIPFEDNYKTIKNVLTMAKKLGYGAVCLNTHISFDPNYKPIKKEKIVAEPADVKKIQTLYPELADGFTILTRLTVELMETVDQHRIKNLLLVSGNKFDLVALKPLSEKLFHAACTEMTCDIITLNMSEKLPFYLRRNPISAAIQRDVFFEVNYSPMIGDATRRITISNGIRLVECAKGKNIIMSSSSQRDMGLRGPYDAMNIGHLIGLKENVLPHIVSTNCRKAVIHGFSRKTARCAIYIQKIKEPENPDKNSDSQKINKCENFVEPDAKKQKVE